MSYHPHLSISIPHLVVIVSHPLNSPPQHLQPPLPHLTLTPFNNQAKSLHHPSPTSPPLSPSPLPLPPPHLQPLTLSPSILPHPRRLLRPLHDFIRDPAHTRAMHPETALRDAILEFIQERDTALALIDVDPHPLVRDLGMAAEFLG